MVDHDVKDKSLAAHFEHTVALTERGVDILSLSDEERARFFAPEVNGYA